VSDQLTALDATFLELEQQDDSAHMHIGGVMLLDPGPDKAPPALGEVRDELARRLLQLPRYSQRLSAPHTGGLRWPHWERDPDFDIAHHVRRAGLTAPGGIEELREWAGDYYSVRLDRRRPLWEIVVLELADGRWALASKTHHCLIDGVGSVDIVHTLLDTSPESPPPEEMPAPPGDAGVKETEPRLPLGPLAGPAMRLARGGLEFARRGIELGERVVGVSTHPALAREALERSRAVAELLVRDELIAAPRGSLNRPIGSGRRLAVLAVRLDELRAIKRALGGTVNDVVLAATAGGLRRLLEQRGEEAPEQGFRAMVPVNLRTAGERLAMGNRVSSLFVHLPVAVADPKERLQRQIEEAEFLKASAQAGATSDIVALAALAPPMLHAFIARALYATRLFNLTITNVPGPQIPLYAFGSRLTEVWPIVPLAAEHAVGLAVFSYDGSLFFCLNADRDAVEDLDVLADGIRASIAELRELAGVVE
jgi:WS/DGAT/MGAT family acyltransferase